jgi:hypothetical protein
MLDLAKARQELATKTILDIERETALTWAGRAAACLDLAHESETRQGKQVRLREAENYRQEAIEHAAMTEDLGFLQDLIAEIDAHKTRQEQRHAEPEDRGERPPRRAFGRRAKADELAPSTSSSPVSRH